jgi:hypothetical protein
LHVVVGYDPGPSEDLVREVREHRHREEPE